MVQLENVLRPDDARAQPAARAARWRARPTRRTAPSASRRRRREPQPHPVNELVELSAGEAIARIEAGELAADEYFDAYAEAAAGDALNAYLWRAEAERARERGDGPARAHRSRSRTSSAPRASRPRPGLADPRGLPPALHGDRGPPSRRRRCQAARQDQHGRVRDGLVERELGLRARSQPVGPGGCPAARQAARPRRSRTAGSVGDRHGHGRLDPPAGVAVRDRRAQADLRRDLALRHGRVRVLARPVRAADPDRRRRRDRCSTSCRAATTSDSTSVGIEARRQAPAATDLKGLRFGVARDFSHHAEGVEPGVAAVFERALALIERLGGEIDEIELPQRRARDLRLLRDRPGRGVVEPPALRRRALRAARGRRLARSPCTSAPAPPASATRSSGGSCSAPTRCRRATTTPTTAAPSGCEPGSPPTSPTPSRRLTWSSPRPRRPSRSSSAPAPPTRWRCTSRTTSRSRCRWRGFRRSRSRPAWRPRLAVRPSCPWACRSPRRPSPRQLCSTPHTRSSRAPWTPRPPGPPLGGQR